MNRFFNRLICAGLLAGSALGLHAVPARQVQRTYQQPDGSSVTLTQRGDEHCHFFTTPSGLIVDQDENGWYRLVANDGTLSPRHIDDTMLATFDASGLDPLKARESLQRQAALTPLSQNRIPARAPRVIAGGKYDNADGHDIRNVPTTGSPHVLIILVDFTDKHFSYCADPGQDMKDMMMKKGYSNFGATGSALDFYSACSLGQYTPKFDVYGPVQLSQNGAFYGANQGGNDKNATGMVAEACQLLDKEVDFSIYDTNGDGEVDNVYVFYAGYGENDGGGSSCIWPHAWELQYAMVPPVLDGVKINRYACSNELNFPRQAGASQKDPTGIGTFCHEFGHVLGQPDMYATDYSDSFTPGPFSAMDQGSYNNNGRTPPAFSAYERYAMEWVKPIEITEASSINMLPISDGGNCYKINIDPANPKEYWLFENRQQTGWDAHIPGHGMLIWHIDYNENVWKSNKVNNTPSHQYVDIVEADNSLNDGSRGGDPWPGTTNATSFTATSVPSFRTWTNKSTKLPITDIVETQGGVISFNVDGGAQSGPLHIDTPRPRLAKATDSSLTVTWPAVAGAKNYYVSVTKNMVDPWFGDFITTPLPGYEFRNVGLDTTLELSDLEEETGYRIEVYAAGDSNLSSTGLGEYNTVTGDFSSAKPGLNVEPDAEAAYLSWPAIDGATEYEVTVATRAESEGSEIESCDFTGKHYPEDWIFTGILDEREDYSGNAIPSLRLTEQTASIMSGWYDDEVAQISFWARVNRNNPNFKLVFYGIEENGCLIPIDVITDIASNKLGSEIKITDIPEGVHQWMCVYTFGTASLQLNIDDISILTRGTVTETPVAGYPKTVTDNVHTATGLQRTTPYIARVQARNSGGVSLPSHTQFFTTLSSSGIASIVADSQIPMFCVQGSTLSCSEAIPFNVYTTDGRQIASAVQGTFTLPAPGLYIASTAKGARTILCR